MTAVSVFSSRGGQTLDSRVAAGFAFSTDFIGKPLPGTLANDKTPRRFRWGSALCSSTPTGKVTLTCQH